MIRGRCGTAEHGLGFCLLTQRRYLYDLEQGFNIIDLSNYDDSDKAFYTVNGALQALPIANTGRGFIWNKTTYDKVGAKIPTTLDELYEAGGEIRACEDGSYYPFACADYVKVHLMIYYLQCNMGRIGLRTMRFSTPRKKSQKD